MRYAEMLWGREGVLEYSDRTARRLADVRHRITQLERIIDLTRRRMDAVGRWGSAVHWWPATPDGFPTKRALVADATERRQLIPYVQHQLILFEEERAA